MNKQKLWKISAIFFISVFLICSFFIVIRFINSRESQSSVENLSEKIKQEENEQETKDSKKEFIDFDELTKINPEIIAWLQIDGTIIDYPVCQSETENSFYLNHDYRKKYNYQGSIYIEKENNKTFDDFNTVIYGHSLTNGNMFRELHNYSDKDFFKEHNQIILYLPDRTRYYTIFETEYASDEHVLMHMDASSAEGRENYINKILSNAAAKSLINNNEIPKESDKIISLSTCRTDKTKRLIIHAVLRDEKIKQ